MKNVDLTGKRFGKLTVISRAENRDSKRYWNCRCDCGNICCVQDSHLKNGHTKSCGCLRKKIGSSKRIDLKEHRYGKLLVLHAATKEEIEELGKKKYEDPWLCRCDCGELSICEKETLRSGTTKSCGCLLKEQRKINMKKAIHFVEGTCIELIAKPKARPGSRSGHLGVYQREGQRWRAEIGFQGKRYALGTYGSIEEAVEARKRAEQGLYQPFLEKFYREQQMGCNILPGEQDSV